MAGAGYKLFNTGDVLTAAQVNTYLQEQAVMRFANAAARTTALSGVLAEGMVSYLMDTDSVEVYNGTSWVGVATGDITGVTAGTGLTGGGTSGDVTLSLSVPVTEVRGGTNQTTYTTGDLLYASGTNTLAKRAIGTTGQVLTVSGGVPTWANAASGSSFVGAYAYKTTSQSIANATSTILTFDAELYDTDNFHSNTTNNSRMTIPSGKAGKYLIIGRVSYLNNATGVRFARIFKNGSVIGDVSLGNAGGTYGTSVDIAIIYDLAVGDYVEVAALQSSGGSLSTQNGGDLYDALMIQYLGA